MLREKGACEEIVAIFETEWPDGMEVSLGNCQRVIALGFDLNWVTDNLLLPSSFGPFAKATYAATQTFLDGKDSAQETYENAVSPDFEAYQSDVDTARKGYKDAMAEALYRAMLESGKYNASRAAEAPLLTWRSLKYPQFNLTPSLNGIPAFRCRPTTRWMSRELTRVNRKHFYRNRLEK